MSILVTADLHLGEDKRNEYRWEFFEDLPNICNTHSVRNLYILGDLFTAKDRHSSNVVNRFVKGLYNITSCGIEITILMGNHDYVDIDEPYFDFLNFITNIQFVTKPIELNNNLFIPNSMFDKKLLKSSYDFVFMHDDIFGAQYENSYVVDTGIDPNFLKDHKVFSGHIHRPQNINKNICYVGSPYPIIFEPPEAKFEPRRVILINDTVDYIPINVCNKFKFKFNEKTFSTLNETLEKYVIGLNKVQAIFEFELQVNKFYYFDEFKKAVRNACDVYNIEFFGCSLKKAKPQKRIRKKVLKSAKPIDIFNSYTVLESIEGDIKSVGERLLED